MIENLYTTKMSSKQKMLHNRFFKICSKKALISYVFSIIILMFVLTTMLYITVVMAMMNEQKEIQSIDSNKAAKINISYFRQKSSKSEPYQNNTPNLSLPQNVFNSKNNSANGAAENIKKQLLNADNKKNIDNKSYIKSSTVSDESYIGFEQIILSDINSEEIQNELQSNGITHSQYGYADLKKNYIVNDISANKTNVTADENGNISIYISVESDNLFGVSITDSVTNENVEQVTVLANNDNIYTFHGFEQEKSYDVEVISKTQNDWDIDGNYIIY